MLEVADVEEVAVGVDGAVVQRRERLPVGLADRAGGVDQGTEADDRLEGELLQKRLDLLGFAVDLLAEDRVVVVLPVALGGEDDDDLPLKEEGDGPVIIAERLLDDLEHRQVAQWVLIAVIGLDQRDQELVAVQVQPILARFGDEGGIIDGVVAGEKGDEELLPDKRQRLAVGDLETVLILAAPDLLIEDRREAGEEVGEVLHRDGLEDVFGDPPPHRLLGIGELIVAAEDHQGGCRVGLLDLLDQLDAVKVGHPDVGDDDIGPQLLDKLQGLDAVSGLAYDGKAVRRPRGAGSDTFTYGGLVIDEENRICHGSMVVPKCSWRKKISRAATSRT